MTSMEIDEAIPSLFAQCRVALVLSKSLPPSVAQKLAATLRLHGGDVLEIEPAGEKFPLEDLTHIVCGSCDFPSYNAACDALIPVVKPQWVDASLAKSKLANPRQYSADSRLFMSDVVICCADLPEGDKDAIIGGVLAMGGLSSVKVASMVTHIVALTMDSEICEKVATKKLNMRIVLPHWFDDCLKLGRRIDENPYLLPDPVILQPSAAFPPRASENGYLNGAIDPDPSQASSTTPYPTARGPLQVFNFKKVMLSHDLGIGSHLKGVLKGLIEESKGQLIENPGKADMFICKFREGPDYRAASVAGKDVGNLAWLYYLITNNSWTSPMRRLLHYPLARDGLPGFRGLRISLSNYSGEARLYLENLIVATGAECTKTLKQDNTHLITAHDVSEKCAAASEWGVHIINHLWLEESYAKWRMQSITNSRYTHFPRRTNLGEVVGQTNIDRHTLEHHFFHQEDIKMEEAEELPQGIQERDPNTTSGIVRSSKVADMRARTNTTGAYEHATPKNVKGPGRIPGSHKIHTPITTRLASDGKENQTPTTTGSRKSKEAAAARLHDLASDIALYEKEKKRVGGVTHGGFRKSDEDRVKGARKRSLSAADNTRAIEGGEPKRSRTQTPSPSMHLLVSGYKKWVGRSKVEAEDCNNLRDLGVVLTSEPARATHLAAPNILRTRKFVSAIAYAPTIISTEFIDRCLDKSKLLDPEDFLLQDTANEKRFNLSLLESQGRAKENCGKLFRDRTFYCVENINGGFETYKSIIEANGGQCNKYRGRPGTVVPSLPANSEANTLNSNDQGSGGNSNSDDDIQSDVFLISGPDRNQNRLWFKFRQMVEESRKIARIVDPSWLIESAMSQQLVQLGPHEIS